jgi:glyoxylase-like metal-dependent hydrolase (beta-lactamase superfamily II)
MTGVTRREAIGRVARVGAGSLAALAAWPDARAFARGPVDPVEDVQIGGVDATPPLRDPRFPMPPTWETQLKEIAPNVYAYIQAGGPGRDNASVANAGIIVGDNGVAVIDTLTAPMHAKAFIAAIRRVTDKPFTHVFLTHHHGDHINGTQYFEGAGVISHPYCRGEIAKAAAAGGPAFWAKREGWADGTEPRKIVVPSTTIDGRRTYRFGTTNLELRTKAPAHTYGDIVAYLPQHGILFAGDIGFFYVAPWCQNAHPSKWIDVCNAIGKMDVRTIVAGHGPLGGKAELADMRDYLVLLKRETRRRYDAKMTAGAAAAGIRMGRYDNWIGPERIVMDVQRFYDEFAGTLTPDVNTAGIRRATDDYNVARKAAAR